MIKAGDNVRHTKDKGLKLGNVREISKSGKTAKVLFKKQDNPGLYWDIVPYYRIDMLELVRGDTKDA